jgi:ankyrin repeat protein
LINGADANLESGPLDDRKTPIMFCANLTPENNDHVPNVTTETLEKLKAQYDIHYPDFPDQWLQSNSQLLMCGAQPYQTDAKQVSAAMTAAHPNHPNVLLEMLTMAEMNEITIGINNTNESQNSLLMVVVKAFSETFNFKKAERNDYLKAISSLLRQGSDPNLRNRKQLSALMIAAQHSVTKIVHTLVTKSILPLDYSLCNESRSIVRGRPVLKW